MLLKICLKAVDSTAQSLFCLLGNHLFLPDSLRDFGMLAVEEFKELRLEPCYLIHRNIQQIFPGRNKQDDDLCLLYTSDAADDLLAV